MTDSAPYPTSAPTTIPAPTLLARLSSFSQHWLLVPKALYFLLNLAFYSCYTFRAKYLREVYGIADNEYGIVAAVLSLVVFLSGYLWSYISDRYGIKDDVELWLT